MGKYKVRTIRLALNLFIVFFFASILYFSPSFLDRPIAFFENGAYDLQVKYDSLPVVIESPIVIVDIDDRSIDEIGHWTWSRKIMGQLVSSLFEKGAAVVGFDVTFPDPERNPAQEVLQAMGPSFAGRAQLEQNIDQFSGDLAFSQALSIRNSHLVIPLVLLLNALASAAFPSFALLTASFVLLKGVDYSLFGVIREMLYIPLKLDEQYRAKVVIDVFAYRSSKALVSLSILGLQLFAGTQLLSYVSSVSIAVFLFWIGVVWFLLRKHYPQPVH